MADWFDSIFAESPREEGPQHPLAQVGLARTLQGNLTLWLDQPGRVWIVLGGTVDLFAMRHTSREPLGPRSHLIRVGAWGALFGVPPDPEEDLGLLATGVPGTRVIDVSQERLGELALEPARGKLGFDAIEGWIQGLSSAVKARLPARDHRRLVAGQEVSLEDGETARPVEGVLWLRLLEGEMRLLGPGIVIPAGRWLPVAMSDWVEARGVARVAVLDTRQALEQGGCWPGLEQFHEILGRRVAARAERRETELRRRLEERREADRSLLRGSLERLVGVIEGEAGGEVPERAAAALVAAARRVGEAQGISVATPPGGPLGRDPVGSIARASRFRVRRVILPADWWRKDLGPLLGFRKDGAAPVALLPAGPSRYRVADPALGSERVVDDEEAAGLESFAFVFYKPFPARALGLLDLLRHGLGRARGEVARIVGWGAAAGLLATLTPIAVGILFDEVLPSARLSALVEVGAALLVVAVAMGLIQVVRGLAMIRLEAKLGPALQAAVWDRLLSLPTPFFRSFTAGDLALRGMGIDAIRRALSVTTVITILTGLFSVFNLALMFYYDAKLAVLGSGLVAVALAASALSGYLQLRHERAHAAQQGKLSGLVLELIQGVSKLRVAGAEARAFAVWTREFTLQRQLAYQVRRIGNAYAVFQAGYPILSAAAIFAMVGLSGGAGLSTGRFLAFNVAFLTFLQGALALTGAVLSALGVVPIYERAQPILETAPEVDEQKLPAGELSGAIEVSHLGFRYGADTPLVLDDLSLNVVPGEFVAVVGPSGCGKSTLLRLLLGFEKPTAGAIYYDGRDLGTLDLRDVRRQIGVVLQNGTLMVGDIATNIIGASGHSVDDAWEAARLAGLAADIEEMPMGMHTLVGEGAGGLSGGQRQRLLLARAILGRPRVLFLDEATSALDNRTQSLVTESLERLQATRVVIAHRLSTIQKADRIVVLHQGAIAESGSFGELMGKRGRFHELASRQLL